MKERMMRLLGLGKKTKDLDDKVIMPLKAAMIKNAYERLFLGPGRVLTQDAQIIISDLFDQSGLTGTNLTRSIDGKISTEDVMINEGKRLMVMGLLRRIYSKPTPLGDNSERENDPDGRDEIARSIIEDIAP